MKRLSPADIRPVVRIANWHDVMQMTRWERSIPDLQFIYIRQGRFSYHDDRGTIFAEPDSVLFIEPGRHHVLSLCDAGPRRRRGRHGATAAISGFHVELIANASWQRGDYRLDPAPTQLTRPAQGDRLRDCFRRAATAWEGHQRWRQSLASVAAHEALLLLAEHWQAPAPDAAGTTQADHVAAMVAWLCQHATRGVGRAALARQFRCSVETVDRRFRQHLGQTPTQVRHREQCRLAWQQLHLHAASVAQAAAAAGFSDPFYFSRVYRRIYGYPPSVGR